MPEDEEDIEEEQSFIHKCMAGCSVKWRGGEEEMLEEEKQERMRELHHGKVLRAFCVCLCFFSMGISSFTINMAYMRLDYKEKQRNGRRRIEIRELEGCSFIANALKEGALRRLKRAFERVEEYQQSLLFS